MTTQYPNWVFPVPFTEFNLPATYTEQNLPSPSAEDNPVTSSWKQVSRIIASPVNKTSDPQAIQEIQDPGDTHSNSVGLFEGPLDQASGSL